MVISDEHPTSFAINTNKVFTSTFILRLDTGKREVYRETLTMMTGAFRGVRTGRSLRHLGFDASGAFGHHIGPSLEFGDTINKFVRRIQVFITRMAKALIPKDAFSLNTNLVDRNGL